MIDKPTNCGVRCVTSFLVEKHISTADTQRHLFLTFVNQSLMSDSEIGKCHLFREGQTNIHDEDHSSHPTSMTGV